MTASPLAVHRYCPIGFTGAAPSIYKDEVEKFQNLLEQARQEDIDALRREFVDLVDNLTDKLRGSDDGKPRKLREAAVENLKDFLASFSNRNLFDDAQRSELVDRCKSIIANTSVNTIA
ncbi:MAG: hypothetical protein IJA79_02435 [Desulfovibrio sp.]|nr:hypothetical protein [Desulfovibrio sp.]